MLPCLTHKKMLSFKISVILISSLAVEVTVTRSAATPAVEVKPVSVPCVSNNTSTDAWSRYLYCSGWGSLLLYAVGSSVYLLKE